jgi:hypothetical protein
MCLPDLCQLGNMKEYIYEADIKTPDDRIMARMLLSS